MKKAGTHILLLEDNEVDCLAFVRKFRDEEGVYSYAYASSLEEGHALLKKESFDVIVSDLNLPDGDAFDFFHAGGKALPTILITGAGDELVAVKAMKQGFSDYLVKDSQGSYLDVLPITIERALETRKMEEALKKHREQLEYLVEERTAQLRKQELHYRAIFETAGTAIIIYDRSGKIEQMNKEAEQLAGITRSEIEGRYSWRDFVPKEELTRLEAFDVALWSGNEDVPDRYTTDIVLPDGTRKQVYVFSSRIEGEDKAVVSLVDITNWKKTQEEVQLLGRVFDQADEAVAIMDTSCKMRYANRAFRDLAKRPDFKREERVLPTCCLAFSLGPVDIVNEIDILLRQGKSWRGQVELNHKDGHTFPADVILFPVRNDQQEINHYAAIIRDITQEKEQEQRYRQAQKMEAIGTLAGGIAHDFNNTLSAILGFAELAKYEVEEGSNLQDFNREIINAGYRAAGLVKQILTFCRQHPEEMGAVDVKRVFKEAISFIQTTLPQHIVVQTDITPDTTIVNADPTQLHQIVMNLATNAYHAMLEKGGTLQLGLFKCDKSSNDVLKGSSLEGDHFIHLQVADTGIGIPASIIDKIFDPFFTTKDVGEGTGLGLATVHGIVEQYKGLIQVSSQEGKGTTFDIYLPESKEEVKEDRDRTSVRRIQRLQGKILVVDDEEALLRLAQSALGTVGLQVDTFSNAKGALEFMQANPKEVDVVLCDYMMPSMTGDTLVKEINAINPDIPIILMSGFMVDNQKEMEEICEVILPKPLDMQDLISRVTSIIRDKQPV